MIFRIRRGIWRRGASRGRSASHNSDYAPVDEARAAIDRYFAERNAFFRENPKRAGGKIWGKERVPNAFREVQDCKDPRYR